MEKGSYYSIGTLCPQYWGERAGAEPHGDHYRITPNGQEYISARIVECEDNAVFFERVYKDSVSSSLFRTADQMKKLYADSFKK